LNIAKIMNERIDKIIRNDNILKLKSYKGRGS